MASVIYNEFKRASAAGEIDLDGAGADVRARLLMSNTTCDTENDAKAKLSDFTTIDASDATGYADQALTTEAITKVDASDRAKFTSDNVVFGSLSGDATRDYQGILLYKYVDGAGNDVPIAYIDFTAPIDKAATQVTVPCPADGWFYLS